MVYRGPLTIKFGPNEDYLDEYDEPLGGPITIKFYKNERYLDEYDRPLKGPLRNPWE